MHSQPWDIKPQLEKVIDTHFYEVIQKLYITDIEHINTINNLLNKLSTQNLSPLEAIHTLELLEQTVAINTNCIHAQESFFSHFKSLENEIFKIIRSFDTIYTLEQTEIVYENQIDDNPIIKTLKLTKRVKKSIKKQWFKIVKPNKEFKEFRKVSLKLIASHYWLYRLPDAIKEVYFNYLQAKQKVMVEVRHSIQGLTPFSSDAILRYQNDFDGLKPLLSKHFEILYKNYDYTSNICGTALLNNSFFNTDLFISRNRVANARFEHLDEQWHNSFLVIRDRINTSIDIDKFNNELNKSIDQFNFQLKEKHDQTIKHIYQEINDFINQNKNQALHTINAKDTLQTNINSAKKDVKNELINEIIPRLIKTIMHKNIPAIALGIDRSIEQAIKYLDKDRKISTKLEVGQSLAGSSISTINPAELVKNQFIGPLNTSVNTCKNLLIEFTNVVQRQLVELGSISLYNLETGINILQKEQSNLQDVIIALNEGFSRVDQKNNDLLKTYDQLIEKCNTALNSAQIELNKNLQKLENSQNIFEINLGMMRAKAKATGKSARQRFLQKIQSLFSFIKVKFNYLISLLTRLYKKTESTLKFQDESEKISIKISNYLSSGQKTFDKLPYVYQLLFSIDALNDPNFLIERKKEHQELYNAYLAWQEGMLSATLIYANKGGGTSTLVNFFNQQIQKETQVVSVHIEYNISTAHELLELFKQLLNYSSFNSCDDLIQYLKESDTKRVIYIADLQRFFIRHINGFEAINTLFELIAQTQKTVFWVAGTTSIGFDFLTKSIKITDNFTKVIKLGSLTDDDLQEMILKRHSVSGYQVSYLADETSTKKAQKIDHDNPQAYLAKSYFKELNKFAEGSLSLAIMQWVRSIQKIENNTIYIKMEKPELDFLKSISQEKLFILHAILLHDGLTEKDLNSIILISPEKISLLLNNLYKDGILELKGNNYTVNQLLYWPITRLLKLKNIVH